MTSSPDLIHKPSCGGAGGEYHRGIMMRSCVAAALLCAVLVVAGAMEEEDGVTSLTEGVLGGDELPMVDGDLGEGE
jgi:hypothetical protein